ncbi:hypothetical protein HYH03_009215 [Edaphochlamys debaryana]|uniref:MYND-type domain-containing protein n=1 Tax=Edaphochlamys debaryana TaxID=47281 RepID=A0A836BY26_9CHLO|nr:hypothetical protein HYH03_009215 [Edaphochlamys debaryana]|eukprot:KAG2492552.1 hypothetical protein HYH03_009215 [Edaphochlamys debaryana]
MGAQALRMAVSNEACAWKARQIEAASEALNELGTKALQQIGEPDLAGLVALLGLALRRAAPNTADMGDAEREAYFHLQRLLMSALVDGNKEALSSDPPANICAALLKSHALRSLSALVASSAGGLLSLGPQRPSRRTLQTSLLLLVEASCLLCQFCNSSRGKSQAVALRVELEASGLLEAWPRLALAVAACDGGEETAAKEVMDLTTAWSTLMAFQNEGAENGVDPWASYLLSGACPSLAFLLTSHVVSFAAELDGGPTYGLPAAGSGSGAGAGPSSGSVRARPPVPLLDSSGALLRRNGVANTLTVLVALKMWTRVQRLLGLACKRLPFDPTYLPFNSAKPFQSWPWGPRLLQHLWAHLTPANPGPDPIDRAWAPVHACVRAAMQRRDPLANPVAAFQLGMRLATLAAHAMLSHSNSPLYSRAGAGGGKPTDFSALVAAHDPAGWLNAGAGTEGDGMTLQAAAAGRRLSAKQCPVLAYGALRLAREALEVPRVALEGLNLRLTVPARRPLAWWRAAVAWAELWQHSSALPGFGADSSPMVGWSGLLGLIEMRSTDRAALEAEPALSCGYLSVLESLLRHPKAELHVAEFFEEEQAWCDAWGPSLLCAEPREIAYLAATLGKLLRRSADQLDAQLAAAGPGEEVAVAIPEWQLALTGALLTDSGAIDFGELAVEPDDPAGEAPAPAAAPGAPASGPGSRLPLVASALAVHLLPSVAAIVKYLLPVALFLRRDAPAEPDVEQLHGDVLRLLWMLLAWLPALLIAAEPSGAGAAPGRPVFAASEPVPASPHAQAWSEFLWRELDPAWMVGAALAAVQGGEGGSPYVMCAALWALVVRAPKRLAAAVAAAEAAEAAMAEANQEAAGESAAVGPSGREGDSLERGPRGKAPPLGPPSLDMLRAVLVEATWPDPIGEGRKVGPCLFAAIRAVCSGAGAGAAAPGSALDPSTWGMGATHLLETTSLLPPPDAARALLPRCSNPACVRLDGPSEAGLRLEACAGGCGRASYCCRACQEAHAAAGHSGECRAAVEARAA